MPLTKDEAAEIHRRVEVQLAADDAIAFSQSLPESGGAYMDQASGGLPVILTVGDPKELMERISSKLPAGVSVRVEHVARSRTQLEGLRDGIWGDRKELAGSGVHLTSASIDVKNNSVQVGVLQGSLESAPAALAKYGPGVMTIAEEADDTLDACVSRIECPPLKGGIKIYRTSNTSQICTSGFIVKRQGTSTLRVLTAGHCIAHGGGLGVGWSHHGSQFGTAQTETYGLLSNADAGLMSLSSLTGDDNLVYQSGPTDIQHVTGWMATASQNQGDLVCRSGKTSGFWCGFITLEDRTRDVDGTDIEHQWVVDVDAIPGDSGAPYFLGTTPTTVLAWGIHSDSTSADPPGGSAWYSPMGWVFSKLSSYGEPITLCTSASC